MNFARVALAAHARTAAAAFSGQGGLFGQGRWHTRGRLIVYVSQYTSLAMLESLVHIQRSTELEPFIHWSIWIPDEWIEHAPELPAQWIKDAPYTQALGDAWLESGKKPAMLVPSALCPEEFNCLINPAHPDFNLSWVNNHPKPCVFDVRLTQP